MIDDLGKEQQPTPPEGQPRERVMEINEWFTPFEDYDEIPYSSRDQKERRKRVAFEVANVGKINFNLNWKPERAETALRFREIHPNLESPVTSLLITPFDEKLISWSKLKEEQEKMESRIMNLHVFKVEFGEKHALPFNVQIELPSGNTISHQIDSIEKWVDQEGKEFNTPALPDIANLLEKLRARIVPVE